MAISEAELARLRAAHTSMLTASCTIQHKVNTTNSAGGAADTWQADLFPTPCRLMPERTTRQSEQVAQRDALTSYYRLTVAYDTDLRPDDRVEFDGHFYQVVALWDDHNWRTARRALVAKVE